MMMDYNDDGLQDANYIYSTLFVGLYEVEL